MQINLVLDLSPRLYSFLSQAVSSVLADLTHLQKQEAQMSEEMDTLVSSVHDLEGVITSAEASYRALADRIADTAGDKKATLALSEELQGVAAQLAAAIPANAPPVLPVIPSTPPTNPDGSPAEEPVPTPS